MKSGKYTNLQKIKDLIDLDPDFIAIKRFDFSLKKALERYPDGAPDKVIAQALNMSEEELKVLYESVLEKLRKKMM